MLGCDLKHPAGLGGSIPTVESEIYLQSSAAAGKREAYRPFQDFSLSGLAEPL